MSIERGTTPMLYTPFMGEEYRSGYAGGLKLLVVGEAQCDGD